MSPVDERVVDDAGNGCARPVGGLGSAAVRWEELFADLEAQVVADERAELDSEVAERTRREAARLRLVDRLRGAEVAGHEVVVSVRGDGGGHPAEHGRVGGVGSDWVLVVRDGVEVLVALAAVESVLGLGPESAEPGSEGTVVARLGLGHALRAVARDRAEVRLATVSGTVLVGTIDRVGADHLELADHPAGEPRLRGPRRLVPFAALATARVAR